MGHGDAELGTLRQDWKEAKVFGRLPEPGIRIQPTDITIFEQDLVSLAEFLVKTDESGT